MPQTPCQILGRFEEVRRQAEDHSESNPNVHRLLESLRMVNSIRGVHVSPSLKAFKDVEGGAVQRGLGRRPGLGLGCSEPVLSGMPAVRPFPGSSFGQVRQIHWAQVSSK